MSVLHLFNSERELVHISVTAASHMTNTFCVHLVHLVLPLCIPSFLLNTHTQEAFHPSSYLLFLFFSLFGI